MLVLVLDTATPAVTAALTCIDPQRVEVRAAAVTVDGRRHGELLAPAIRTVLDQAGTRANQVRAVVAGVGPGPFTGLRVGLVTAAAFGSALGIATYGVCSLDGLAAGGGGPLLVATDARRKEVYWAAYDASGRRVAGPAVDRPDALVTRLPELGAAAMAGAGAEQYQQVLGLPHHPPAFPDPRRLAELARARVLGAAPSERLTPLYLRRPDAVPPGVPKPVTRP